MTLAVLDNKIPSFFGGVHDLYYNQLKGKLSKKIKTLKHITTSLKFSFVTYLTRKYLTFPRAP